MSDYRKEMDDLNNYLNINDQQSSLVIVNKIKNYLKNAPSQAHEKAALHMLKFYERVNYDKMFSSYASHKAKLSGIKDSSISREDYTKIRKDFDSLNNKKEDK